MTFRGWEFSITSGRTCAALDKPSVCVEKLPLEAKIGYCRTLEPDARRDCYNKAFAGEPEDGRRRGR